MKNLTSDEIINLLENLIGNTEPGCDETLDRYVAHANEQVIDVGNWVLDTIRATAKYCGRPEMSAHKIGFDAKCALMDWRNWIDSVLNQLDGGTE